MLPLRSAAGRIFAPTGCLRSLGSSLFFSREIARAGRSSSSSFTNSFPFYYFGYFFPFFFSPPLLRCVSLVVFLVETIGSDDLRHLVPRCPRRRVAVGHRLATLLHIPARGPADRQEGPDVSGLTGSLVHSVYFFMLMLLLYNQFISVNVVWPEDAT